MRRTLPAVVVLALAMAARPAAHQLDEYLQAARIAFARDRVVLEIDLTPGANIAGEIVGALDRDGDGVVLPLEARAYGEAVIGDLELTFDGRPVRLQLEAIEVPAVADMRRGVGTMQLTAVGPLEDGRAGTRRLRFTNRHHPETSVYLANALVSADRDVQVVAQRRDRRQQQLDVEYEIGSRWPVQLTWVLFGATVMVAQMAARRYHVLIRT
jgi:nickel/cobalt exporter